MVSPPTLDLAEQVPDPGAMHLGADEIALRRRRGLFGQAVAVAETDLQGHRRLAAEDRRQIQHPGVGRRIQAEARPELIQRALLAGGQTPLAAHERANPAMVRRAPPVPVSGPVVVRFVRDRHEPAKNSPVSGEEAEA